jgi:uroporphyrinogen-III decarboxylase
LDEERELQEKLSNRERFVRLFNGDPVDRVPFLDIMGFWQSSLDRWKTEGLAADATQKTVRELVGFDGGRGYMLPIKGYIWPEFERKVLEEDGTRIRVRNRWGGIELDMTDSDVMPVTISGPVKDRATWEEIKERLDLDTPGRLPANWSDLCRQAAASGEPVYTGDLPLGFFGAPRELLGFEQLSFLFYDDPDLAHEILDTLCELWVKLLVRVQKDITLDWYFIWEDMCCKNGPLISPDLFREFLLPYYKRFTAALRRGGCKHILVDSDGDQRPLTPLWIEGGVNILFPWETQFGLDITEVRRQYPELGMIGGIDKFALAHGRDAIDKELEKIPFMLEHGRYIPGLDHGVPPDVSWDDYRYFYDRLRELIWKHPPR